MDQGPEDSKDWRGEEFKGSVIVVCARCKMDISFWHCDERGCPWCAACGSRKGAKT